MGNYRFKLSDMIPNAWFYKLKDMSKSRNQKVIPYSSSSKKKSPHQSSSSSSFSSNVTAPRVHVHPHLSDQRKSYYFTRDLTYENVETKTIISDSHSKEPPRKSSKKRRSTRRNNRVSNKATSPKSVTTSTVNTKGCNCRATVESSVWNKPDSTPEEYPNSPLDSSSDNEAEFGSNPCVTPETFDEKDIIVDIKNNPINPKFQELPAYKVNRLMNLPPIITKNVPNYPAPKEQRNSHSRRFLSSSSQGGLKLRTNSPRIVNRRNIIQGGGRKSVSSSTSARSSKRSSSMSESFAVVKSSRDPQRDFKESMVEMIIENNICASKDLEDLLACYLSLNSNDYHDLIISVFKQIWFEVVDINHHPK